MTEFGRGPDVCTLSRVWLWGTLVWLAAMTPAHAQGVEWQVHAGFEGVCSYDSPVPVLVEFTNNGPARKGQLTIGSRREGRGDDTVRYIVPLDLPENSHKTYSLEVRNPSQRRLILTLGGRSETRDLKNIREVATEHVLIVAISENPSLLQFLDRSTMPPGGMGMPMGGPSGPSSTGALAIGHASPGTMPRSWAGWQGVDIAVVAAERLSEASPEEIDALRQWVQLGGQLVVNGGVFAPGMASGPLGEMLPLKVKGTRTIKHLQAVGAWVGQPIEDQETLIADGRAVVGARVLCGTLALPLITVRDVGAGAVAMTAFDFTGRPVKYWDGQEKMWARLVAALDVNRGRTDRYGPRPTGFLPGGAGGFTSSLVRAARSHVEPGLPSPGLVLGFLLAYIIVLVPVSYIILARRDRREWAWITTPIVVLIFTFGAYGMGYLSRGGKTIIDRVALVVAQSGDSAALGSGTVSIFSPGSRNYTFDLNGSVASPNWSAETGSADPADVVFGPQRKITGFRINKWSCRSLTADFVADLGEGIEATAVLDGHELTATVTNNTGLSLRGCRILRGQQEGRRVDLAPGASAQLPFDSPTEAGNIDLNTGNDPYGYSGGRRASARRRQLYAKHDLNDLVVAELARGVPEYQYGMPVAVSDGNRPYLLAICDDPMLTVDPIRTRARLTDCTVIIVPLEVTVPVGNRVAIEDWMVSREVSGAEGTSSTVTRNGRETTILVNMTEYDLQVELGEKRCRARKLVLRVTSPSERSYPQPTSGPEAAVVQVWSLSRGAWVELDSGAQPHPPGGAFPGGPGEAKAIEYTIEPPGDFMTEDGLVRVRLSVQSDVQIADVELTGEIEIY